MRELVDALRAELTPPPEPPALVDLTTAARLLGVSRTSLYQRMDAGELPSRKLGRRRLIPRVALEAYAAGRES
jgi:excisionase family DNA binding protein